MTKINPDDITNIIVPGKSGAGKQPRIDVLLEEYGLEQLSTGDIFRTYLGKFNNFDYSGDLKQFYDDEKNCFISDEKILESLGTDDKEILLGLKAKYFVDQGLFVPDYITNELFKSFFAKKSFKKQVLDGYPRTEDQAKYLLDLIQYENSKIDLVVLVENDDDKIIKRTVKRRICPKCKKVFHLEFKPPKDGEICVACGAEVIQRSDDTEEKIKSRLAEFQSKALPALKYLEGNNIPVVKVPGHLEVFTTENVRNSVMDEIKKLY